MKNNGFNPNAFLLREQAKRQASNIKIALGILQLARAVSKDGQQKLAQIKFEDGTVEVYIRGVLPGDPHPVALRPEVMAFARLMELRLRDYGEAIMKNDKAQLQEILNESVHRFQQAIDSDIAQQIMQEAVDCANLCLVTTDKILRGGTDGQKADGSGESKALEGEQKAT